MATRSLWKCPKCRVKQIQQGSGKGAIGPYCERCGCTFRFLGDRESDDRSWSERLKENVFHMGCMSEWVGICLLAGGFGAIAGDYHTIDGVVNIERMFFIGIAFFLGMGFLIKGVLQQYLAKK